MLNPFFWCNACMTDSCLASFYSGLIFGFEKNKFIFQIAGCKYFYKLNQILWQDDMRQDDIS